MKSYLLTATNALRFHARLRVFYFALCVVPLMAACSSHDSKCCCSPRLSEKVKAARGWERYELLLTEVESKLEIGMTKEQVQSIAGHPDNLDGDVIWLWVCDGSPSYCRPMGGWQEISRNADDRIPFLFLCFDTVGHLMSHFIRSTNMNGDVWHTYQGLAEIPMENVEELLGKRKRP